VAESKTFEDVPPTVIPPLPVTLITPALETSKAAPEFVTAIPTLPPKVIEPVALFSEATPVTPSPARRNKGMLNPDASFVPRHVILGGRDGDQISPD
jgi:hypothetical protein